MKRKVLITAEVHEYLTERLRNSTCEVVYQPKIGVRRVAELCCLTALSKPQD